MSHAKRRAISPLSSTKTDEAVTELPRNTVVVTVVWHDYYRYLTLDVQAHPDMLQAALAA